MSQNPTDPTGKNNPGDQKSQTTPGTEERQKETQNPGTEGLKNPQSPGTEKREWNESTPSENTETTEQQRKNETTRRENEYPRHENAEEPDSDFNVLKKPGVEKPDMPHKHESDPFTAESNDSTGQPHTGTEENSPNR